MEPLRQRRYSLCQFLARLVRDRTDSRADWRGTATRRSGEIGDTRAQSIWAMCSIVYLQQKVCYVLKEALQRLENKLTKRFLESLKN